MHHLDHPRAGRARGGSVIALLAARAALAKAGGFLASLPVWVYYVLGALLVMGTTYHMGRSHERKIADAQMADYKAKQVAQVVTIVKKEVQVVTEVQIEYRDRIQKVYVRGAEIEKHITDYVQPADDARFAVNAGFLRNIDAAWAGAAVGPAVDSDREPAGIPISAIAAVEARNITSCRVWREQALGWRDFYARQQVAINGKAGDWFKNSGAEDSQGKTPITAADAAPIGASP